jgi:hypothetical protein
MSTAKKAIATVLVLALATTAFLLGREVEPLSPSAGAQVALPVPEGTERGAGEEAASAAESQTRSALAEEPKPAPAAPAQTGSLLLEVRWHDGTPAAGVVARLYCNGAEDFYADTVEVTTGADGTKLTEGLPPGRVAAYLDRGPVEDCKVAAGEQAKLEIKIPRGYDIAGEVVGREGRPIAGAEVLVDGMGNGWNAYRVERTDAEGRFRIRSYERGLCWITARAALRAPSPQVQVVGGKVDIEGLRIVLDGSGASVAGVVLDPQGQPLGGAQVLLGRENAYDQVTLENGQQARAPAAQFVTADEAGRFEFAGAPIGKLDVQARSKGLAPWKGEIETVEGARAEFVIRMQQGARLHGRATDSQGAPIRAEIQANGDYGFGQRHRRTGADGNFIVTGLPAGEFVVKASADGFLDASTTLIGTPGADLAWNPVLGSGLKISGRLVGKEIDFSKWWVYCESEDWQKAPYAQSATPKADGSFEFTGCGDAKHRIRAHLPGANFFPVVSFEARPGGDLVLVPVDAAMLPSCRLRGRILDENGKPAAGVEFGVSLTGANLSPIETADAEGRFDFGLVPPGEYRITSRAAGYCPLRSETATLAANANWDFGDLQLVRGGTVAVHLARPASGQVAFELRRGDGSEWIGVQGDHGSSGAVEPGEYELRAWVDGQQVELAAGVVRVSVRAGEESRVEIALP